MRNLAAVIALSLVGFGCGSKESESGNGAAGMSSNTDDVDASAAAGGTSSNGEDGGGMATAGSAGSAGMGNSGGNLDDLSPPGDGVISATITVNGMTGTIVCPMTLIMVGENLDISDRVGGDSCERVPEDTHVSVGNFPLMEATSIMQPAFFEFEVGGPADRIFSADATEFSFTIESYDEMAGTLKAEMHVVAPIGEAHLWIDKQ
jgi:hypothetical protein